MNQNELTKPFMMISTLKRPFDLHVYAKIVSALMVKGLI